jgi:hypothetical protein
VIFNLVFPWFLPSNINWYFNQYGFEGITTWKTILNRSLQIPKFPKTRDVKSNKRANSKLYIIKNTEANSLRSRYCKSLRCTSSHHFSLGNFGGHNIQPACKRKRPYLTYEVLAQNGWKWNQRFELIKHPDNSVRRSPPRLGGGGLMTRKEKNNVPARIYMCYGGPRGGPVKKKK